MVEKSQNKIMSLEWWVAGYTKQHLIELRSSAYLNFCSSGLRQVVFFKYFMSFWPGSNNTHCTHACISTLCLVMPAGTAWYSLGGRNNPFISFSKGLTFLQCQFFLGNSLTYSIRSGTRLSRSLKGYTKREKGLVLQQLIDRGVLWLFVTWHLFLLLFFVFFFFFRASFCFLLISKCKKQLIKKQTQKHHHPGNDKLKRNQHINQQKKKKHSTPAASVCPEYDGYVDLWPTMFLAFGVTVWATDACAWLYCLCLSGLPSVPTYTETFEVRSAWGQFRLGCGFAAPDVK